MRSAARAGLLLLLFVVLTLAYVYPLGERLADAVVMPPGVGRNILMYDAYLCAWILAAGARGLVTAPASLFDGNIYHPLPLSLATSENLLGYAPLAAPVFWWTDNPVLSAHVALFGSYAIGGVGMFLLTRRFAGGPASLIAALAYVFVPWRLPSIALLPQLATHWLPFVVLTSERAIAYGRRRDFATVAAAVWANGMTTLNYGVSGFFLVPLVALVRLRSVREHPARLVGLALGLLVAALALLPVLWPYAALSSRGVLASAKVGAGSFPILFVPHLLARYGIPPIALAVVLVGAVVSLLWRRRQPGWALGVGLMVLSVLLVLGRELRLPGTTVVVPMPLWLLEQLIPALASLRAPSRFIMIAGLALALMLGLAVDRLLGLVSGKIRTVAAVVLTLVIGADLFWRRSGFEVVPVPVGTTTPHVYGYLREHGAGRALLEIPIGGPGDAIRQASAVYLSTNHWLPLLNGFASHTPPGFAYLTKLILRLPDVNALQALVNVVDVGWIVVHEADMPIWWPKLRWGPAPPGLRQVGRFGTDVLYAVLLQPTQDLREPFRRWYADPRHETFPLAAGTAPPS